jgi:hypothetical protein
MKTFTRDATVQLKFSFRNADGDIVNPVAGAFVAISYVPHVDGSAPTTVDYPLVQSGNEWIYEWDSSVSAPCIVYVHGETNDGLPVSAIDAEFRLSANRSNKQLAGDF